MNPVVTFWTEGSNTVISISIDDVNWTPNSGTRGWTWLELDANAFRGIRSWGTAFPVNSWRDFDASNYSNAVIWPARTQAENILHNTTVARLFQNITCTTRYSGCMQEFIEGIDLRVRNAPVDGATNFAFILILAKVTGPDKSLDLSNWYTSRVTSIAEGFKSSEFDLSGLDSWDMSQLVSASEAFSGMSALTTPGCGAWNVSNLTSLFATFNGCTNFADDLSTWERSTPGDVSTTANIDTARSAFAFCEVFNSDLTGWNVNSLENTQGMFQGAISFRHNLVLWAQTGSPTRMANLVSARFMFLSATAQVAAPELSMRGIWESEYPTANFQFWWQ